LAKTMGHSVCKLDIMQNVFFSPGKDFVCVARGVVYVAEESAIDVGWAGKEDGTKSEIVIDINDANILDMETICQKKQRYVLKGRVVFSVLNSYGVTFARQAQVQAEIIND
jgi:hypothetical protein